ncbi:hypothetical protein BOX15_Mlig008331g1, partial [Macrostomum lignano]
SLGMNSTEPYPLRLALTAAQAHVLAMRASNFNSGSAEIRAKFLIIHDQLQESDSANPAKFILQLFGDTETCSAACRRLLKNMCSGNSDRPSTLRMLLDPAHVGKIVGRGGVTIKNIQFESHAKVFIFDTPLALMTECSQSVAFTLAKVALVRGSLTAVASAIEQLLALSRSLYLANPPISLVPKRLWLRLQQLGHWLDNPEQFVDAFLAARSINRKAQRLAGRLFYGKSGRFNDSWNSGLAETLNAAEVAAASKESLVRELHCLVHLTCLYSPVGVELIKSAFKAGKAAAAAVGHELTVRVVGSPEYRLILKPAASASAASPTVPSEAAMSAVLTEIQSWIASAGQADGCEFRVLDRGPTDSKIHRQQLLALLPRSRRRDSSVDSESDGDKENDSKEEEGPVCEKQPTWKPSVKGALGRDSWHFAFGVTFFKNAGSSIARCLSRSLDDCYC